MAKQNEAQIIETSKALLDMIQVRATAEKFSPESVHHLAEAFALIVQNTPDEPVHAYIG